MPHKRGKYTHWFKAVKNEIPEISFNNKILYSDKVVDYFNFYNLSYEKTVHYFGYFKFNGQKIVSHVFKPKSPNATIYLLHGYLDHVGCLSRIIKVLVENNYNVASFDFPGHGLSDGERSSIGAFEEYLRCFSLFYDFTNKNLEKPFHVIGFSTGVSIAFDFIYMNSDTFSKKIFAAPLIRPYAWKLSTFGFYLLKDFIHKLPRAFRKDTHDKTFYYFRKYIDPLQDRYTSFKWVESLIEWYNKIQSYKKLDTRLLIIQGDNDKTVDWKYNLKFLEEKIDKAEIKIIKNAGHQLFNEDEKIFKEIKKCIIDYLKN